MMKANGKHPDRPRDVLDLLLTEVVECDFELVPDLVPHYPAEANSPWCGQTLQTGREVDAVAEDISVLDNDVALVNADPKLDPLLYGRADVSLEHATLHLDRAASGIDDAGKFDQQAVAHRLYNAAVVFLDLGIAKFAPNRSQRG